MEINLSDNLIDKLSDDLNLFREERSIELFNRPEYDLSVGEKITLEKYINDYKSPVWKDIIFNGAPTHYEVSNLGCVRNKNSGKILKGTKNHSGYLKLGLVIDRNVFTMKIHRLVAQTFIPNPENKRGVNHISCVKTCNWVGNLEWVTSSENKKHARIHGLYHEKCGEDATNSVYTNKQVHEVCRLLELGKQPKEVSETVGVPVNLVNSIKYYGKWKSISSQYNIPKANELPRTKTHYHNTGIIYSEDIVRKACDMLSAGKTNAEVSKTLNIGEATISNIRNGKRWKNISSEYHFPPMKDRFDPIVKHKNEVVSLLTSGETNFTKIIEMVGVPDTKQARQYISLQLHNLKK